MSIEKNETTKTEDGYEEVKPKSNYINFNKVNDYVKGTYVSVFNPEQPDMYGKKNPSFTLLVDEGSFHKGGKDETGNYVVDTKATKPEAGTEWRIGSKPAVTRAMEEIKIGQKVIFKLEEFRKSEKGQPAKIIKVLGGPINKEYLDKLEEEKKTSTEW